jgi:hypothetical protein
LRNLENFYYDALYDLLRDQNDYSKKGATLRIIKAKIILLHVTGIRNIIRYRRKGSL